MKPIQIYADTKAEGRCQSCHAPIVWAQLTNGARMPFNFPLIPASGYRSGTRMVDVIDLTVSTSHFATCPDAKRWRRR
jgi:hypothetical protein